MPSGERAGTRRGRGSGFNFQKDSVMTASKTWERLGRPAIRAGVVLVALGPVVAWGLTRPQETPVQPKASVAAAARPADPRALALLAEVAKAYKNLGTYSDDGHFVMAMTIAGKPQKQTLPLKLRFARPNKLDLDAGPVRLVSDGKTMITTVLPLKRYTSEPAPEQIDIETFRRGPSVRSSLAGLREPRCSSC